MERVRAWGGRSQIYFWAGPSISRRALASCAPGRFDRASAAMAGASSDDADATDSQADEQARDAGSSAHPVHAPAREAGEPGSDAGASARRVSAAAREARSPARDAGRSARAADDRTPLADDRTPHADGRSIEAEGPGSEARDPTRLASAPASQPRVPGSEAHDRASEARAPDREPDAPDREPDAPTSLAEYRDRVTRPAVSLEDFRAFLARAETRGWVAAIVRERVPAKDADDLAQDALAEALKAFVRAPPAKEEVLVAWIATIARRVVADFLKKRGRRRKYEGSMPDDPDSRESESESSSADDESDRVAEPSYDPREGSVDDLELKGRSLLQWLERQVAHSPRDRETLEILLEHGLGQKTYQTIADERGITLTVLSSRIFEFRNKYVARYKRERERTWLLLLLFLFGAAVVAVLVWLLSAHGRPHRETVGPSTPSIIDRALGRPLPVGRGRPDDVPAPDGGAGAP